MPDQEFIDGEWIISFRVNARILEADEDAEDLIRVPYSPAFCILGNLLNNLS